MPTADSVQGREGIPSPPPQAWTPAAVVTVVDVADFGRPQVVTTLRLEGSFVSGRLVDGLVRLVLHSGPSQLFANAGSPEEMKRRIAESGPTDWLPSYRQQDVSGNVVEGDLVRCEDTYRPVDFSGPQTISVVT